MAFSLPVIVPLAFFPKVPVQFQDRSKVAAQFEIGLRFQNFENCINLEIARNIYMYIIASPYLKYQYANNIVVRESLNGPTMT